MDFTQSVKNEIADKYKAMLSSKAECSFDDGLIASFDAYENKAAAYQSRLDKERRAFNDAISTVNNRRQQRETSERNHSERCAERKAKRKYIADKTLESLIFILPIALAIIVGIDLFSPISGREFANKGGVITGYVFLCLAMTAASLTLFIRLHQKVVYRNRHDISHKAKYRNFAIVVAVLFFGICATNFGLYVKKGVETVDVFNEKISSIIEQDDINYAVNEKLICGSYLEYNDLSFWQKWFVKDKDRYFNIIAGYNEYKTDEVRTAMNLITLENVAEENILKNAVLLYAALNSEQRKLLTVDEIQLFDTYSTVANVVDSLYEINNDIIDKYDNIGKILNVYKSIDDKYKAYVYNYYLVAEFADRYEYFGQFIFEPVDGGYSIKAKDGVNIKGVLDIPQKYKDGDIVLIPENAFKNKTSITSVIIPNTVTSIGVGAFSGCSGIQDMTLPFVGHLADGCGFQSSGNWGLNGSGVISSPNIGNSTSTTYTLSILSSGTLSFYYKTSTEGSDKLTVYKNDSSVMTASGETGYTYYEIAVNQGDVVKFTYSKDGSVAKGDDKVYLNFSTTYFGYIFGMPNGYTDQNNLIPRTLTELTITNQKFIPEYAFYGDTKLVDLTLPESTQSIGAYVFYGCTELSRINSSVDSVFNIPTSVKALSKYSFYNCSKLQKLTCGNITSIGGYALYDCTQLSEFNTNTSNSIKVGLGCTLIGEYAFANCNLITSVYVEEDVTSIGVGAFSGCSGIQDMTLPFVGHLADGCGFQSSGNWGLNGSGVISSPNIGNSTSTTYTLSILSSGTLSFYYKTSTEGSDKLTVYKNDSSVMTASGETGYTYYEIAVNQGDVVKFTYSKDGSVAKGDDKVYLNFSTTYFGYIFGMPNGYTDQNNLIPRTLTELTITNQRFIPEYAFYGCSNLQKIHYTQGINRRGKDALYNCSASVN